MDSLPTNSAYVLRNVVPTNFMTHQPKDVPAYEDWEESMESVLSVPKELRQLLMVFALTADQMNNYPMEDAFAGVDSLITLLKSVLLVTSFEMASSPPVFDQDTPAE
mgnify:CR=1 FL=1